MPHLDRDSAAHMAETFRLLGEPNRLQLICLCLDEPQSVEELTRHLGLSQSLTSHHLRLLRAARLMRAERRGRHMLYQAGDEHVRCIVADMLEHVDEEED